MLSFSRNCREQRPRERKYASISKSKVPGKVCLFTDTNVGAGLEPGQISFGNLGDICLAYKGAPAHSIKGNTLEIGLTMDRA